MKKIVIVLAVLAVTSTAWAADAGNILRDENYHGEWGYRDWQAYEGNIEMADLYWGVSSTNEVSMRFTPATTVNMTTVRTRWYSGGSSTGASRNVSVWIESSVNSAANYHAPAVDMAYNPEPWAIPGGQVSPLIAVMPVQAADMTVDFMVGPTVLNAGQTYHIRVSAAPNATAQKDKLRLAAGSKYANKAYNVLNNNRNANSNYRNADGACLCAGTPAVDKMGVIYQPGPYGCGQDGLALMWEKDVIDPYGAVLPYNKWCEGEIWNDGIEDYVKYKEPRFELLFYDQPTGVGQGSDARAPVAVPQAWYGEKFQTDATSPALTDELRMYIKKTPGAVGNLDIALLAGDGSLIAMGTRTAASIPDFYDVAVDGSAVNDWGWVSVKIPTTNLVPGAMYAVVAQAANAGEYELMQQDFSVGGLEINSTAASYQGAVGRAWSVGTGDIPNSDVLFLIPEPATMTLLVLGGLGVLLKRRRN